VRGRIAPLISVGVGFHRELTGRENIFVNGSMLGMTRRQLSQRLDEIVSFSGVEGFIDTPVKFYSSGMFVRLGFSVAAHCQPDVLIVDEVLAVGDLAYQLKCFDKMNEIRTEGTTVVMVSHHLGVIRRMCERVLLVHEGVPRCLGTPEQAIGAFHELLSSTSDMQIDEDSGLRYEPQVVQIEDVELTDAEGRPTREMTAGETMGVRVRARALHAVDDLVIALTIAAGDGTIIYADSSVGTRFGYVEQGEHCSCMMSFRCQFPTGSYHATVRIDRPDLRTTLAHHPAAAFFVTGRHTVTGLADLGTNFIRDEPEHEQPVLVGSEESR
jgi:ABC-type multidrug transport system ATPase subunit